MTPFTKLDNKINTEYFYKTQLNHIEKEYPKLFWKYTRIGIMYGIILGTMLGIAIGLII